MYVDVLGQWVVEPLHTESMEIAPRPNSPETKETRGAKLKWSPLVVVPEDLEIARGIFKEYGGDRSTRDRLRTNFKTFQSINHHLEMPEILSYLIGQWRRCGLEPGTMVTYLGYISNSFVGVHRAYFQGWRQCLKAMHTDTNELKTIDEDDAQLLKRLKECRAHPCVVFRAMLWLLVTTGSRCRDLARLRSSQVHLIRDGSTILGVRIQFRLTKNRKHVWLRINITFPTFVIIEQPDAEVIDFLSSSSRSLHPFQKFNHKGAASHFRNESKVQMCGVKVFRRAFVNRVLRRFKKNYSRVIQLTGHLRESTVQAFYEQFHNII